ncbi:MAG TPA: RNA 2',3'-cyclic phosphodiesterase [Acidobacteriota bacterium]|nr:RNA 2',3'-cyclic phosphodiesterase [Acidobacteriota bacterium]
MRTFIAIPLPNESQVILDQMQQSLRTCKADVRWVAIPSIHLTLKFLGEVDPEAIPKLSEKLQEESKNLRPFELSLQGLGCFPNARNPRVVWCGIEGATDSLLRLQAAVESASTKLGFAPENRSFRPHLTLGRVQGRKNLPLLADRIAADSDLACGFRADRFHIYKSTLKPQGAVYTVLNTIVLNEN